jgi:hypothetical protein
MPCGRQAVGCKDAQFLVDHRRRSTGLVAERDSSLRENRAARRRIRCWFGRLVLGKEPADADMDCTTRRLRVFLLALVTLSRDWRDRRPRAWPLGSLIEGSGPCFLLFDGEAHEHFDHRFNPAAWDNREAGCFWASGQQGARQSIAGSITAGCIGPMSLREIIRDNAQSSSRSGWPPLPLEVWSHTLCEQIDSWLYNVAPIVPFELTF